MRGVPEKLDRMMEDRGDSSKPKPFSLWVVVELLGGVDRVAEERADDLVGVSGCVVWRMVEKTICARSAKKKLQRWP